MSLAKIGSGAAACFRASVLVALLGAPAGEVDASTPALQWRHEQVERTAGWKDTVLRFQFEFKNVSRNTVVLREVATSCGCAEVDRRVLGSYAPGAGGRVEVVYRIGNRTGRRLETIYLETDDPKQKVVELRVMAVIPELVVFQPGVASWKRDETPATRTIQAEWRGPGRARLVSARTIDAGWRVAVRAGDRTNAWNLDITPGSTASDLIAKILIDFEQAETGPRTVEAYGVVQQQP